MFRGQLKIELTADQALVFFEWLMREGTDKDTLAFEHEAEEHVLWAVEAQLEEKLVEPFDPNYRELVSEARRRIIEGR